MSLDMHIPGAGRQPGQFASRAGTAGASGAVRVSPAFLRAGRMMPLLDWQP